MQIGDLTGEKIGICVSGGLDSKSVTARLREAGLDVVGFTADLAQPDEDDIEVKRGAAEPVVMAPETAVRPGDIIRVNERFF